MVTLFILPSRVCFVFFLFFIVIICVGQYFSKYKYNNLFVNFGCVWMYVGCVSVLYNKKVSKFFKSNHRQSYFPFFYLAHYFQFETN